MRNPEELKKVFEIVANKNHEMAEKEELRDKYMASVLKTFKENMTEEEQLFIFKELMGSLHYRSVMTDPDHILELNNAKLRVHGFYFLLGIIFMVIAAAVFGGSPLLNSFVESVVGLVNFVSI